jgi:hypothetical protein
MLILTRLKLESPTSPDVTSPHGIEVERNELHDISLTPSPPKYFGNAVDRDQLKIHCTRKCRLVTRRGQGKAKWLEPNTILLYELSNAEKKNHPAMAGR